jgi:hypothetical protein
MNILNLLIILVILFIIYKLYTGAEYFNNIIRPTTNYKINNGLCKNNKKKDTDLSKYIDTILKSKKKKKLKSLFL